MKRGTGYQSRATAEDWRPILQALAAEVGNDWPEAALERLLFLTGKHGYGGSWADDETERAEQRELWALAGWVFYLVEAGIAFTQTQ